MTKSTEPVRVIEETPAYWRVLFDYPPFNIVDATIFGGLQDLLARIGASPSLRVVVFESANPEFYLAHFDLTGKTGNITTATQQRIQALLKRGLQREDDFEHRWPALLGTLLDTARGD